MSSSPIITPTKGETGDVGPQGDQGSQGEQGLQGDAGLGVPVGTTVQAAMYWDGAAWIETVNVLLDPTGHIKTIRDGGRPRWNIQRRDPAPLANGNNCGALAWTCNDDTASIVGTVAQIAALSDDVHTDTSKPGRLIFYTASSGATVATEKMRIDSDGVIKGLFTGVGITQKDSKFEVVAVLPGTPDANTIYFVTT